MINSRRTRWVEYVAHMEKETGNAYNILVGKPERMTYA
jgi:hypothetical protein